MRVTDDAEEVVLKEKPEDTPSQRTSSETKTPMTCKINIIIKLAVSFSGVDCNKFETRN